MSIKISPGSVYEKCPQHTKSHSLPIWGQKKKYTNIYKTNHASAPCNTENPAKWLFVTPYKSTCNQLVEEVVVTAT